MKHVKEKGRHEIRGLYFGPTTISPPPPPIPKMIFFPLSRHAVFDSYHALFALILPYFALILPFYFLFSLLLSTFPFFPFLPFFLHFPPLSLPLFIFYPLNDIG
jgi:hypothetical protein